MELSEEEKTFIEFYKNFHKNIHSPIKWSNTYKEKMWIDIYKKLPIDSSNNSLLFLDIDEQSIINELESIITNSNIKT